jgi:GntR family transcriptional regulator, rspAB operon transcriptional repressor
MRQTRTPEVARLPLRQVVKLERIQYVTLTLRVYRAIKERILSGEIPVGRRLHCEDLAAQLGVSRTPVREAMMMLTREGLVEVIARSQTRVRTFTERDLDEIFDLRTALETLAIRKSVDRLRPEQLKRLCGMYRKSEAAMKRGNSKPVFEFDQELHRTILEASGNSRLQDMMAAINDYVVLFRNIGLTTITHRGHTARHSDILKALEHGDAEGAARAMTEHLLVSKEQTLRDFEQRRLLNHGSKRVDDHATTTPARRAEHSVRAGSGASASLSSGVVSPPPKTASPRRA